MCPPVVQPCPTASAPAPPPPRRAAARRPRPTAWRRGARTPSSGPAGCACGRSTAPAAAARRRWSTRTPPRRRSRRERARARGVCGGAVDRRAGRPRRRRWPLPWLQEGCRPRAGAPGPLRSPRRTSSRATGPALAGRRRAVVLRLVCARRHEGALPVAGEAPHRRRRRRQVRAADAQAAGALSARARVWPVGERRVTPGDLSRLPCKVNRRISAQPSRHIYSVGLRRVTRDDGPGVWRGCLRQATRLAQSKRHGSRVLATTGRGERRRRRRRCERPRREQRGGERRRNQRRRTRVCRASPSRLSLERQECKEVLRGVVLEGGRLQGEGWGPETGGGVPPRRVHVAQGAQHSPLQKDARITRARVDERARTGAARAPTELPPLPPVREPR
jgi:hypothetical protein